MKAPSGALDHPLTPLNIPVHPKMAEILRYPGQAQRVAFYLENAGYEAIYHDGLFSANRIDRELFAEFLRHQRVQRALANHPLVANSANGETLHWLVLDRDIQQLYVAEPDDALQFLLEQYNFASTSTPPQPYVVSSTEELEAQGQQAFEKAIQSNQWQHTQRFVISLAEAQALLVVRDLECREFLDWLGAA